MNSKVSVADFPLPDLRRYAPDVAEPADFDAFRLDTLSGAAGHPMLVDRTAYAAYNRHGTARQLRRLESVLAH